MAFFSTILHSQQGPHAHLVLEAVAYFLGARCYWHVAARQPRPAFNDQVLLLGLLIMGAFVGSKLLHWAHHLDWLRQQELQPWAAGKSILGGLIGGTLAAELGKRLIGWRRATGDAWVAPLTLGILVGRLGCQLSGTWDQTYGVPTSLPWGWDYGDGLLRHPTSLYEMVLVSLIYALTRLSIWRSHAGARFAVFAGLYCLARFGLEHLKPPFGLAAADDLPITLYGPLTAIQWVALIGAGYFTLSLAHRMRQKEHNNG